MSDWKQTRNKGITQTVLINYFTWNLTCLPAVFSRPPKTKARMKSSLKDAIEFASVYSTNSFKCGTSRMLTAVLKGVKMANQCTPPTQKDTEVLWILNTQADRHFGLKLKLIRHRINYQGIDTSHRWLSKLHQK